MLAITIVDPLLLGPISISHSARNKSKMFLFSDPPIINIFPVAPSHTWISITLRWGLLTLILTVSYSIRVVIDELKNQEGFHYIDLDDEEEEHSL